MKRKIIIIAVLSVIIAAVLAFISIAIFITKGSKGGIIIAGQTYFNSNVLTEISDIADAGDYHLNCRKGSSIIIRNYSISTGAYNNFDINYRLYATVEGDISDNAYDYYIVKEDQTRVRISATATDIGLFTLSGNTHNLNEFEITYENNNIGSDMSVHGLIVYAIPTSPSYMQNNLIGACLYMTEESEFAFSANGHFTVNTDYDITDYYGYLYLVTTSGYIVDGTEQVVSITYDCDNLTYDVNNSIAGISNVINGSVGVISFVADTDMVYSITFYRGDEPLSTYEALNQAISITVAERDILGS